MNNDNDNLNFNKLENNVVNLQNKENYCANDAIKELDELKNIALNCYDKNGNPNVSVALRAIENKAKIAGLYKQNNAVQTNFVKMNEIKINGEQLKFQIGEDISEE